MLRKSTLVATLCALSLAFGCGNKSNRDDRPKAVEKGETAQEMFLAANKMLDEGDYKEAIKIYGKAAYRDPSRWDIYMNKAIAHSRAAQFELALGAIELAFQNGGSSEPEVYYNLGNIYQERGMYKESIEAYRAGLAYREGPDIDSLINIGSAYVFLRRFPEATATFEHLRAVAPDEPAAVHGLALIQHLQDNYQQAAELYDQVHAMSPSFANSYFNHGAVLARMEKYEEAIAAMNGYLRYAPDGPYAEQAKKRIENYKDRARR